jgi:hypothetical protein
LFREVFPESKIGVGTDYDFTEINRYRINAELFDFIVYSICPQVHACDNFSLIENLAAQLETVESAKAIYPGKLVHASVISLLRRSNPDATGKSDISKDDRFDHRQYSLFGAQWALGTIKYLAESGSSLITQFELIGKRGLILKDYNEIQIKRSPYSYILETIHNCDVIEIIPVKSSNPLIVEAVLLKSDQYHLLILINFSDKAETITIDKTLKIYESLVYDQYAFLEFKNAGGVPSVFSENNFQDVIHNKLFVPANSIMFLKVHMTSSLKVE